MCFMSRGGFWVLVRSVDNDMNVVVIYIISNVLQSMISLSLVTALFVGITVWGVMSSFFYIAERNNPDMIYCGAAPDYCFLNEDDVDTRLCIIDEWGVVDCSAAGCESQDGKEVCWNLYRSIVDASFWTLMELFGEFPLVDQHSVFGKVLGTFTAVIAVAVFALPAGIFGSGFEDQIAKRREKKIRLAEVGGAAVDVGDAVEQEVDVDITGGDASNRRGRLYNFFHRQNSSLSKASETFINVLILGTTLSFTFDTITDDYITTSWHIFFDRFQFFAVVVFTAEYVCLVYSAAEDPNYRGSGRLTYVQDFLRMVDLMSIVPYWIVVLLTQQLILSNDSTIAILAQFCLILRLFRFEKHSKAFTTFDDVLRDNMDVLTVTGFSALLLWVLFASILYITERDNPDDEMANNYKTVPNAMWMTLLNLSGECPLAHYTNAGKVCVGIIGLFATAIFGVPIGILGAGFEEIVTSENEDVPDQPMNVSTSYAPTVYSFQISCYKFVNGIGSKAAAIFETSIYLLIGATVLIGVIQTVDGLEDTFGWVEWVAVVVFTFEYVTRFVGAAADPEFANASSGFMSKINFLFSFYSVIDLLAIVPFYLAWAMLGSWVDQHDEYLRMLRLLRLLKLDKYVPSISLVDDVIRLKRRVLVVSCFAAATLWVLFSGLMYIAEYRDYSESIDNLPLYGCYENCSMSDRYENMIKAIPLTGIHLTGDFPMTEYSGYGRIVLFFMVIAAVGVVSIPSGVIASGFAEIVQSKSKSRGGEASTGNAGDDWFDIKYRQLEGRSPPLSIFGSKVDVLQRNVKAYLDGSIDEKGVRTRTTLSKAGRGFFLGLIIANILAVILESIPEIDKRVGNQKGNFFDEFEAWSVFFFTVGTLNTKCLLVSVLSRAKYVANTPFAVFQQTIFCVWSRQERAGKLCIRLGSMQQPSLA